MQTLSYDTSVTGDKKSETFHTGFEFKGPISYKRSYLYFLTDDLAVQPCKTVNSPKNSIDLQKTAYICLSPFAASYK